MGRILVTGAAGFIGAAIAKKLIDDGNDVWTIDNLSTGFIENIPEKCHFVQGNTFDDSILSGVLNEMKEIDAIIHIAGQSSGEISFDDPEYDLNSNVTSTIKLLELAKKVNCKKFIYASSMSVYGDVEDKPIDENCSTFPKTYYAVGKLASENYMRIYSGYGIKCTALRFYNVYGPGQNMDNLRQGMVSIYLAQALENGNVLVKGSKDRFRDFVYIDDVVDAVIMSMNKETPSLFNIFNVCTGVRTTVEQVLSTINKSLDDDITIEYTDGTPGDQFGIYGNHDRITSLLGWRPKMSFEDGIVNMIMWAKKN